MARNLNRSFERSKSSKADLSEPLNLEPKELSLHHRDGIVDVLKAKGYFEQDLIRSASEEYLSLLLSEFELAEKFPNEFQSKVISNGEDWKDRQTVQNVRGQKSALSKIISKALAKKELFDKCADKAKCQLSSLYGSSQLLIQLQAMAAVKVCSVPDPISKVKDSSPSELMEEINLYPEGCDSEARESLILLFDSCKPRIVSEQLLKEAKTEYVDLVRTEHDLKTRYRKEFKAEVEECTEANGDNEGNTEFYRKNIPDKGPIWKVIDKALRSNLSEIANNSLHPYYSLKRSKQLLISLERKASFNSSSIQEHHLDKGDTQPKFKYTGEVQQCGTSAGFDKSLTRGQDSQSLDIGRVPSVSVPDWKEERGSKDEDLRGRDNRSQVPSILQDSLVHMRDAGKRSIGHGSKLGDSRGLDNKFGDRDEDFFQPGLSLGGNKSYRGPNNKKGDLNEYNQQPGILDQSLDGNKSFRTRYNRKGDPDEIPDPSGGLNQSTDGKKSLRDPGDRLGDPDYMFHQPGIVPQSKGGDKSLSCRDIRTGDQDEYFHQPGRLDQRIDENKSFRGHVYRLGDTENLNTFDRSAKEFKGSQSFDSSSRSAAERRQLEEYGKGSIAGSINSFMGDRNDSVTSLGFGNFMTVDTRESSSQRTRDEIRNRLAGANLKTSYRYKDHRKPLEHQGAVPDASIYIPDPAELGAMVPRKDYEDLYKSWETQKSDIEELTNRLSSFASRQLSEGNPNIADLSDKNRPTKIGENFSLLYDDEWSEAYEALKKSHKDEEIVHKLLRVVTEGYKHCIRRAEALIERLEESMKDTIIGGQLSTRGADRQKQEVQDLDKRLKSTTHKLAKEYRKATAQVSSAEVIKDFLRSQAIKETFNEDCEHLPRKVKDYIASCTEQLWYMSVQDPPMIIESAEPGTGVKKEFYKFYERKGTIVQVTVWPVVFLHKNGPLISKGYVLPK